MKINKDEIYEMIAKILDIDIVSAKAINDDEDFINHGMTSILAIQLVVMLEEKYKFEFRDEDLFFNSFKKLFDLLESY